MTVQTIVLRAGREDAGQACRYLEKLPKDSPWRVTVEPYKPKRSNEQNAYLWGVCYRKFQDTLEGWDLDDIHDWLLGLHFGNEQLVTPDGEVVGDKPIRRSSRLNKQEFSDYISHVQRKAAEFGIYIPDPEYPEVDG